MVRGIYLYWNDVFDQNAILTGIDNKVKDQITLFNKQGLNCTLLTCPRSVKGNRVLAKLRGFLSDKITWPSLDALKDADYLYMRRPDFVSHVYVSWLKEVRQRYPKLKIIYEIPTYPYDGEWTGLQGLCVRIKDTKNRRKLKQYVDRIADLSGEQEIFGIPTLPISNGVSLSQISVRHPKRTQFINKVNILCVAYYSKWHGIDRLLEGMQKYYGAENKDLIDIKLHLVGGGNRQYIAELKRLVTAYHLEEHVDFVGPVARSNLDDFYDMCDFAIESLGVYRRKTVKYSYSIKSREYLAKGMPFVYSTPIDLEKFAPIPYCFKVSEDDSPVPISEMIDYYLDLYQQKNEVSVAQDLRDYAEQWTTLDRALSSVVNYIKRIGDESRQ